METKVHVRPRGNYFLRLPQACTLGRFRQWLAHRLRRALQVGFVEAQYALNETVESAQPSGIAQRGERVEGDFSHEHILVSSYRAQGHYRVVT